MNTQLILEVSLFLERFAFFTMKKKKEKPLKNWLLNMRLMIQKKIVTKRLNVNGIRYVCWK